MIQVNNKFEVGQEVYTVEKSIRRVENTKKCDTCEGTGVIVYKGKNLKCPCCNNGTIVTGVDKVSMYSIDDSGKITSIRFQYANEKSNFIRYKINGTFVPEERIAQSKEDAIALCDKLNEEVTAYCNGENINLVGDSTSDDKSGIAVMI